MLRFVSMRKKFGNFLYFRPLYSACLMAVMLHFPKVSFVFMSCAIVKESFIL